MLPGGITSHSPKEHLGNKGEVPTTVRDRGGVEGQRGGWRPREEGRQEA